MINYIAIFLAFLSLVWASRTLNFSKRSFVVKDSYNPLLDCLNSIKRFRRTNSEQINVGYLDGLIQSYLFSAFEKKERILIGAIIDTVKKINEFKSKAPSVAQRIIMETLLGEEYLPAPSENDYVLGDIILKNNTKRDWYDLVVNEGITISLEFREIDIFCLIGTFEPRTYEYYGETIEENEFIQIKGVDIEKYVNSFTKIDPPDKMLSYYSPFELFCSSFNSDLIRELNKKESYIQYCRDCNELAEQVDMLSYLINERIRWLLIPNYFWKKSYKILYRQVVNVWLKMYGNDKTK
ncbi:hypothetical protein RZN22_13455 [Bacillaceae bacterium S4-13-58]